MGSHGRDLQAFCGNAGRIANGERLRSESEQGSSGAHGSLKTGDKRSERRERERERERERNEKRDETRKPGCCIC